MNTSKIFLAIYRERAWTLLEHDTPGAALKEAMGRWAGFEWKILKELIVRVEEDAGAPDDVSGD